MSKTPLSPSSGTSLSVALEPAAAGIRIVSSTGDDAIIPAAMLNQFGSGGGGGGSASVMTGATSSANGVSGLAPQPLAGQQNYALHGDGTFRQVAASEVSGLAAVATSGAYSALSGTPTLGSLAALSAVNNGQWSGTALAIGNGGTGQTSASAAFNALSPLTTAGDIIYGGTSGAGTRLGIGSAGQILTVSGGVPSWASNALLTGLGGPNTHNANYTFVAADVGCMLRHTDGSNYTWTIDTFANAPIAAGQIIYGTCESTGTLTIAAPSGGSLIRLDGTAGTGNRTIGAASEFVLKKLDGANAWAISGSALS